MENIDTVAVFASRYTHNRNTGGAYIVIRSLKNLWSTLAVDTRSQIVAESHEANENNEEWMQFRKWAKNYK